MSANEETPDLKAGHPPAVKAGGMRITQHKTTHPDKPVAEPKKETEEDETEEQEEEVALKPTPVVISGVVAKGDSDFPTASVKAFHEKTPAPTHEFRHNPPNKPNVGIHQPRK